MSPNPPKSWSRLLSTYITEAGTPVPQLEVSAVAEAVAAQARANIGVLSDRLQAGQISAEEFRTGMQAAIKAGNGAEMVLARGGMDEIRPADWVRLADRNAAQFEYLEGHLERITSGAYGPSLQSSAFNVHSQAYGDSMRIAYVAERKELHREQGYTRVKRLLSGGADHCDECVELAAQGFVDVEDSVDLGDCQCGQNCQCSEIFARSGDN
jgi:hypothetical protein